MNKRKDFSPEFKREAVRLLAKKGRSALLLNRLLLSQHSRTAELEAEMIYFTFSNTIL
jgi:transposase-like protein